MASLLGEGRWVEEQEGTDYTKVRREGEKRGKGERERGERRGLGRGGERIFVKMRVFLSLG